MCETTRQPVPKDRIRVLGLDDDRRAELRKAFLILRYAHESASALLDALRLVRKQRPATRGALTDEEQDLLRATLVMAASGLDGMTKQIIRDILPTFCRHDQAVQQKFVDFAARKIRGDGEGVMTRDTSKLLANVLTSESPQRALIEAYVDRLTGGSLQSVDELFKVAAALGVSSRILDENTLKPIFDDRNAIIHELDVDFDAPRRNRNSRPLGHMITSTNRILQLSQAIYEVCEQKLTDVQPEAGGAA